MTQDWDLKFLCRKTEMYAKLFQKSLKFGKNDHGNRPYALKNKKNLRHSFFKTKTSVIFFIVNVVFFALEIL